MTIEELFAALDPFPRDAEVTLTERPPVGVTIPHDRYDPGHIARTHDGTIALVPKRERRKL